MIPLYVRISASLISMRAPAVAATVAQQSLTRGFESCCNALPASSLDAWHLRPLKRQVCISEPSMCHSSATQLKRWLKPIYSTAHLSQKLHLPPPVSPLQC